MSRTPTTQLRADEAHVWIARPGEIAEGALLDGYRSLLSSDERRRIDRLHFARDRHERLISVALTRTTLSRYADVEPAAWRFERSERGRPEPAPDACSLPLRFNVSHTTGLVACAVTLDREIGVDVEWRKRSGRTIAIAERYFSPTEVRALGALPERRRRRRFFDYWTLKEAYVKARGAGLALPLEKFSFDPATEPIRVAFHRDLKDDPKSWQFELHYPTDQHTLAVGVRRTPGTRLVIRVRETAPGRVLADDE